MFKLSLLTTLLVGAWSLPVLGCLKQPIPKVFYKENIIGGSCRPYAITSGGGKWHSSKGETGRFVSVLRSRACFPLHQPIGNYGSSQLHLTIHLDNGRSEKFAWSVHNTPPLFWISEDEGSEHVFASDGAVVSIRYAQDEEQSIITVVRDAKELVLQDKGLSFKTLPKMSEAQLLREMIKGLEGPENMEKLEELTPLH